MNKKTLLFIFFLHLFAPLAIGQNIAELTCIDPEVFNSVGNWDDHDAVITTSILPDTSDGTSYLRVTDAASTSSSWIYNSDDYDGDYSDQSYCLCWDYNVFSDGLAGSADMTPLIRIYNGDNPRDATLNAYYRPGFTITENGGWTKICASIGPNITLVAPGEAGWSMAPGSTSADWNNLIEDLSGIAFPVDVAGSPSQNEIIGFDNVCFGVCVDCSPTNFFAYDFRDVNMSIRTSFCMDEDVYLKGTLFKPTNGKYYIDINILNADGSLTWVGDQDVTGWANGTPDWINITTLFENDPEVPVVFQPNTTYQVKLAIDDEDCGWLERVQTFTYTIPTVVGHTEDEDGNDKSVFCIGEDVFLNGSDTPLWNGDSYYIDLHIVNPDGSLSWVGDQDVTGWANGSIDFINITKLFENDPEGAVTFQPNTIYQIKLAIDDDYCGWFDTTINFTYYGATVSAHLEDENGNQQTTFCLGDPVLLDGSDTTWLGSSFYIDLQIINEDGSLTWVGDQDVTGWVNGTPDLVNITKTFENDPEVPVVFIPNVTYQVKFAVDDDRCGWTETILTFTYIQPTVSAFLQDSNGNPTTVFCVGDDVWLNGSDTLPWNGNSYYLDLHIVNPDGSLAWVGDQEVTGWVNGTPDLINITKLFENDPEVPVNFLPDTTYQVKLAIDDDYCGWTEFITTFRLEDCCQLSPPTTIQTIGSTVLWNPVPGAVGYIVHSNSSWPSDCSCNQPISMVPIQTSNTSVTLPLGFDNCTSIVIETICADGSTSIPSDPICVRFGHTIKKSATVATISPNPNKGMMNIKVVTNADIKDVSLKIYNFNGHQVQVFEQLKIDKGVVDFNLDVRSKLKQGIYIFIFTTKDEVITKRIIIE